MIKIKDERIEIEGSGEEIAKEFALIAAFLVETFKKKSGKLFTPEEILLAGVMLIEREVNSVAEAVKMAKDLFGIMGVEAEIKAA